MYLIKEGSFTTLNPIYQRISVEDGKMFIPEARVAKDYFASQFYEKGYIDWCINNHFIQPDKNVIDVGAHIGWYSVNFAKCAKHVYSFECSPKSYNYLCANIALNEQDYKVTKFNTGLSDKTGIAKYYIRDPNDGGCNGISKFQGDDNIPCIDVPVKTLDSYELSNINFIKIDVEGHEKQVLMGASKTITENNYPSILFECWDDSPDKSHLPTQQIREELFDTFHTFEYKIQNIGTDMYIAKR
jgi:FkbM family methyltransferase